MYGLKLWTLRLEHAAEQRAAAASGQAAAGMATGLLLATFIDVAVDGFIIGAGFAAGGETGTILAIGLSVELLFLGLALASDSIRGWKIVAVSGALGLTVLGCAILGSMLLAQASHDTIGTVLAFSAAALLYLVTEELLMEAHEVEKSPSSAWCCLQAFWCSGPSSCSARAECPGTVVFAKEIVHAL